MTKETVAYLYQLREDLLPFITESGEISFEKKSVKKEIKRLQKREEDASHLEKFSHAVQICVREDGVDFKVKGFGVSFEDAAKNAKEEAVKMLQKISEKVLSNSDRLNEISSILSKENILH